jgi:hypothetical protein
MVEFSLAIKYWEDIMDYNNNNVPPVNPQVNNNNYYNHNQPNGMATAALVLGIISFITFCCIFGSYLFGGIAITLGLLSRGKNKKLDTKALIGIIISIISIVGSTAIIIYYSVVLLTSYDSVDDFMKDYENYYEEFYGEEFPLDSDMFNQDDTTQPQQFDLPGSLTITLNP